jgi:hypothetical protein
MAITECDGANSYAYVLSNTAGGNTDAGTLWQYGVESTGELTAASPPMLNIGPVAVAQVTQVNSLYVLTTNSGTNDSASAGGNMNFYSLGAGGAATLTAPQRSVLLTRLPWPCISCQHRSRLARRRCGSYTEHYTDANSMDHGFLAQSMTASPAASAILLSLSGSGRSRSA